MRARTWLFAAALSVSGLALAQSGSSTVTQITDPAKIAEIEQHAKQLAAGGQAETMPAMGQHEQMRQQKSRAKPHRSMKNKAKSKAKDKAAPDMPMATESKG